MILKEFLEFLQLLFKEQYELENMVEYCKKIEDLFEDEYNKTHVLKFNKNL